MIKRCSKCHSEFNCCNEQSGCWCEELFLDIETLQQLKKEFDNCLCKSCLSEYVSPAAQPQS